jgi:hypothetical protein
VGKDGLCKRISPGFAPRNAHETSHRNNVIFVNLDASLEPILLSSLGPRREGSAPLNQQFVTLKLTILNPSDEDETVLRMTPSILKEQDVIGLCYNVARPETLERAVHKV